VRCSALSFASNKKASSQGEKRLKTWAALLIFLRPAPKLDLAPGRLERIRSRLPWFHRASPSTTLHETVASTDADTLMQERSNVKSFFRRDIPWQVQWAQLTLNGQQYENLCGTDQT